MSGRVPRDEPLRVALASADPERRDRLARLVSEAGHLVAVGTEDTDILLVDLPNGGELPRGVLLPMLVLTERSGAAQDPHVAGVLPREATFRSLGAALLAVAAGLQVRPMDRSEARGFAAADEEGPPVLLTPREMEILAAISEGSSNKQVARRLGISTHTVKFHLEAIFAKLEVGSRAEAVAKGLRRGLIEI